MNSLQSPKQSVFLTNLFLIAVSGLLCHPSNGLQAQEYDGFLEPIRKIELASDETGVIMELGVEEGDYVQQDQTIALLDNRTQQIQMEIAKVAAESLSQKLAAEESYQKRLLMNQKIEKLRREGHASESELARAEIELSIAKARLMTAEEEVILRELEYRKTEIQLKRRAITAPFSGFIAKIHSREGEFVSPLRPEIASLIQTDQLIAKINVPVSQVSMLEVGKTWSLKLASGRSVMAQIQSIGVEVNAESETVEVRLVIENSDYQLKSGERVTLIL